MKNVSSAASQCCEAVLQANRHNDAAWPHAETLSIPKPQREISLQRKSNVIQNAGDRYIKADTHPFSLSVKQSIAPSTVIESIGCGEMFPAMTVQ